MSAQIAARWFSWPNMLFFGARPCFDRNRRCYNLAGIRRRRRGALLLRCLARERIRLIPLFNCFVGALQVKCIVIPTTRSPKMSMIDTAVRANRSYAKRHDPKLADRPAPKIAVVTCMDPRLSNLPEILGLPHSDIDVIRTGGPAVTEDVLGELVVSTRVLGTTEILLLNHTGCGFTTFTDDELNSKLTASTGISSPAPMRFFAYKDPAQNAREQIRTVRAHPWIAKEIPVRGFVFDMKTGLLTEVEAADQASNAVREGDNAI
jgi:carbonic anhydrase